LSGDREGGHGDNEYQPAHALRVSGVADYSARWSSPFTFVVSPANPACSQSFSAAAASVQVSTRPKRGAKPVLR